MAPPHGPPFPAGLARRPRLPPRVLWWDIAKQTASVAPAGARTPGEEPPGKAGAPQVLGARLDGEGSPPRAPPESGTATEMLLQETHV